MKRATLVYVGPTLSSAEVLRLLPSATVMPPVAVGDVLRALPSRPARIAIIDGYFERMAAVWHKEILHALERGIEVWGAASMGALRAAELAPYGMRGVGSIFKAFARGTLTRDDEVAVAHLPAEYAYRPTSVALVDLRDAIARAPMLAAKDRALLLSASQARFYRERTWSQAVADVAGRIAAVKLEDFARWIAKETPSRKADDARLLLRTLVRTKSVKRTGERVPRTWAFAQLARWLVNETPRGRRRQR